MVRRKITLGDREFDVGPMGLGTIRRVPEAFQIAGRYKPTPGQMPSSEEFEAILSLVYDGINADQLNKKHAPAIDRDTFDELVNGMGISDGLKAMLDAIQSIMATRGRVLTPEEVSAVGNSDSSESMKSPVSSD